MIKCELAICSSFYRYYEKTDIQTFNSIMIVLEMDTSDTQYNLKGGGWVTSVTTTTEE